MGSNPAPRTEPVYDRGQDEHVVIIYDQIANSAGKSTNRISRCGCPQTQRFLDEGSVLPKLSYALSHIAHPVEIKDESDDMQICANSSLYGRINAVLDAAAAVSESPQDYSTDKRLMSLQESLAYIVLADDDVFGP